jgi:hypothetical protein
VSGSAPVSSGDTLSLIAGGAGGTRQGGTSAFGSGGSTPAGAPSSQVGGGGGASALSLDGTLLAVSGGGGGGAEYHFKTNPFPAGQNVQRDSNKSNGGEQGLGRQIISEGQTSYTSYAVGGSPGTSQSPGAGGRYLGSQNQAANGNAGSGRSGADGAYVNVGNAVSGAGGGGYFGGGSGSVMYRTFSDGWIAPTSAGGGGSNFVDSSVLDAQQGVANSAEGSVVVIFS